MEISPILLTRLLMYSFFLGAAIGVFYDTSRIIRVFLGAGEMNSIRKRQFSWKLPFSDRRVSLLNQNKKIGFFGNAVVFLGDFLTVIFGALGLIVLNYAYNDGKFRGFTVIGLLIGYFAYRFLLGKPIIKLLYPLVFLIKYVFFAFFVVLWQPLKIVLKIVAKNARKIYFFCKFVLEKRRKKEYNIYEKVYLRELSKNGFLTEENFVDTKEILSKKQEV